MECTTALEAGAEVCSGCAQGKWGTKDKFVLNKLVDCQICPMGWFAEGGDKDSCTQCELGRHGNGRVEASKCASCEAGKYTTNENVVWTLNIASTDIGATHGALVTQGSTTGRLDVALTGGAVTALQVCSGLDATFDAGQAISILENGWCGPDANVVGTSTYPTCTAECTNNPSCSAVRWVESSNVCNLMSSCDVTDGDVAQKNYIRVLDLVVSSTTSATKKARYFDEPSTCMDCPKGKYGPSRNAKEASSCILCNAGTFQTVMGANHIALCLLCPAGRRSNDVGREEECQACSAGQFSQAVGATAACSTCPAGYVSLGFDETTKSGGARCTPCFPGTFQEGFEECSNCEPGLFTSLFSQTVCAECLAGQYQSEGGKAFCLDCMQGTTAIYNASSSCSICLEGTFLPDIKSTIPCKICPQGFSQKKPGMSNCEQCKVGKQANKMYGSTSCTHCLPGLFLEHPNNDTTCVACSQGTYSDQGGSATCLNCPSGWVQNLLEKSSCDMCGENYFSAAQVGSEMKETTSGGTACIACPIGYQQNQPGSSACHLCSVGKYGVNGALRNMGEGACVQCQPGRYRNFDPKTQKTQDLTQCQTCPSSWHQPAPGSSACYKCAAGKANHLPKQSDCVDCLENYFAANTSQLTCDKCPKGQYTSKRLGSASCQECPAGTAGNGCQSCDPGYYRGTSDSTVTCLRCEPGTFATDAEAPFCLECDAGSFAAEFKSTICTQCPKGKYQERKRKTGCELCHGALVANERGTACETPTVSPNAAVPTLMSVEAVTRDAKYLTVTYRLSTSLDPERTAGLALIEKHDRLEVQIATRPDFKSGIRQIVLDLPTSNVGDSTPVHFSFVVQPSNATLSDDGVTELTRIGSAWSQLRYFRVRVLKQNGKAGTMSTRNDAWAIASQCSDGLYLRTHPEDDLTQPPLAILSIDAEVVVPSCLPCPQNANCRGERTFAQIVARDGNRALPWDNRGFGICPRKPACLGNDITMVLSTNEFEWDGNNSTRYEPPCHQGHQGQFCAECDMYYDTKLGDNQGLCQQCPDSTENMLRLIGLGVAAVFVLTFLVYDSLTGVDEIAAAVLNGKDAKVPFHSVGIRIVSSFMQVAGLLNNFRLELPEAVVTLVTAQSAVSGVGGAVISFNCLLPETRGSELFVFRILTIVVLLPAVMMCAVVLFWTIYGCCCLCLDKKRGKDKEPTTSNVPTALDKMIGSTLVLYYLTFPSILNGMTSAMSCTTYGVVSSGLSKVLLDDALDMECYQEKHIVLLLTILIPAFVIFVIFIPCIVCLSMHKLYLKDCLLPHQKHFNPISCYRYGFLFLGYEQEFYGWEIVVMLRKAAFVVVSGSLRPYGPVSQVVGASSILIVALSLHLQQRPYDSDGHDVMESVSLHTSLIILMGVLMCSMVGKNLDGSLGPVSSIVLIVLVFASTYYFVHVATKHIAKHSHDHPGLLGKIARICSKKTHNDRRHSIHRRQNKHVQRGSTSRVTAVLPITKRGGGGGKMAEKLRMGVQNATNQNIVNSVEKEHDEGLEAHVKKTKEMHTAHAAHTAQRIAKRKSRTNSLRGVVNII